MRGLLETFLSGSRGGPRPYLMTGPTYGDFLYRLVYREFRKSLNACDPLEDMSRPTHDVVPDSQITMLNRKYGTTQNRNTASG